MPVLYPRGFGKLHFWIKIAYDYNRNPSLFCYSENNTTRKGIEIRSQPFLEFIVFAVSYEIQFDNLACYIYTQRKNDIPMFHIRKKRIANKWSVRSWWQYDECNCIVSCSQYIGVKIISKKHNKPNNRPGSHFLIN